MSRFPPDFATARLEFREALAACGGRLDALPLEARGPSGEALTIDVGWIGDEAATRVVVHACGVHGVEAFAGSAIQRETLIAGVDVPPGRALVLVHVVNPYGMAWLRRVNEQNVDLNRNCLGPGERYEGAPPGYEALDAFLNPAAPAPFDLFYWRAARLVARHGMAALKQAIAGGQYVNPQGLFYGGRSLEAGPAALRAFLRERLARVTHVVGIDVHTGLGPFGVDTLLVDAAAGSAGYVRTARMFGGRVTPLDPDRGPAYRARGTFFALFRSALPHADLLFVGQEFGTYGAVRVLRALRLENAWHRSGASAVQHPARTALRETFAPADPAWRARVLERGRAVLARAMAALA